jgi:TonB family protein
MTTYLIQVSVALILFYGLYALFLKQETNFRVVRIFLVVALLVSVFLPAVNIDLLIAPFVTDSDAIYEYWLPDLTVGSQPIVNPNDGSSLIWNVIVTIYLTGVLFASSKFLLSLFKLKALLRNSKMKQDGSGWYYILEDGLGSFSFFHYIFIGSKSWHSNADQQNILAHERAHASLWHSADVLAVQLLMIMVWFNPIIYWYRKALEELHEFEADLSVSGKIEPEAYCNLLAKETLDTAQLSMANHFHKSLTLKRILMIKSTRKKISPIKMLGLVSSAILITVLIACEEKVLTDMKRASGQSVLLTEYPKEVQEAINTIKVKNPNAQLQVYGVVKTADLEQLDLDGKIATMLFRESDPDYKAYVILGADDVSFAAKNLFELKDGEKIYSIVQEPAQPVKGMTDFYQYVAANLKYPEQARTMGVEGRVFMKFLVDEAGKISDIQVIRGIGAGCDAEAKRILSEAPNWKPGMQDGVAVKSTFNLAILFKLSNTPEKEVRDN